jgi:hypothetical protein
MTVPQRAGCSALAFGEWASQQMDTIQTVASYTLSILLFLLGAYALLAAWVPIPAKYMENRMSRGAGARIAGLVFALALPLAFFIAPKLGHSDAMFADAHNKHSEAVLEAGRDFRKLSEEYLHDRDNSKESHQRAERRVAEMKELTERLHRMRHDDEVQLAEHEARATHSWQWKILAGCFGLGMLIARYTGKESSPDKTANTPQDASAAQA